MRNSYILKSVLLYYCYLQETNLKISVFPLYECPRLTENEQVINVFSASGPLDLTQALIPKHFSQTRVKFGGKAAKRDEGELLHI